MKYPAIIEVNNLAFMAFDKENIIAFNGHSRLCADYAHESQFKNVTREYLEGKCVKIESPEHSEFVQRLAFGSGFKWPQSFGKVKHTGHLYLFFKSHGHINCANNNHESIEEITIPMPPKENSASKNDEWRVGDTVTWGSFVATGEIKAISDNLAWVKNEYGNYNNVLLADLKKPKTPEQELSAKIECLVHEKLSEHFVGLGSLMGIGDLASMLTSDLEAEFDIKDKS